MALFLITGNSGTGKSTVWQELKNRGFEAYDVDEDGIAKWQNNRTGFIHPKSSIKKEARTPEFLKHHAWNVPRDEVEELAERAKDRTVFLCGLGTNESEMLDLFKAVFALVVDDKTLEQRLLTRTGNDWGKQPHELQQSLAWQRGARDTYQKLGYIVIDATMPVETVTDSILASLAD